MMKNKISLITIVFATFTLLMTIGCDSTQAPRQPIAEEKEPAEGQHVTEKTYVKMYGGVPHVMKKKIIVATE